MIARLLAIAMALAVSAHATLTGGEEGRRRIVIVTGAKTHGPGQHDHPMNAKLLTVLLRRSGIAAQVEVDCRLDGWPSEEAPIAAAHTLVILSDGRDGARGGKREALHLENAERVALVERQMRRGCGLVLLHFATFAPDELAEQALRWTGGYFDWSADIGKGWHSAIATLTADVEPVAADHPTLRGIERFNIRDEFYFNLRFAPDDRALSHLLRVPALAKARAGDGAVVAWARTREDGGRGFGTSMGHYYDNWQNPAWRKLVLNALAWTAGVAVPPRGVDSAHLDRAAVDTAFAASAP